MILNGKAVSIAEAAAILKMKVDEVYRLAVHGLIGQTKPSEGRMMVSRDSVEQYAKRNGIVLQESPNPSARLYGSRTIEQAKAFLDLKNDNDIHKFIQAGRLLARFECGAYVIDLQSLHDCARLIDGK